MRTRPKSFAWGRPGFARSALSILAVAVLALWSVSSPAETFPDRPIRLVVPFAPGGNNDIIARLVAQKAGDILRQPIVIDNKAGAGGLIGAGFVAHADADGYILLQGNTATISIQPLLATAPPYEPAAFAPITVLGTSPLILVVTRALGAISVADLIGRVRSQPNRFNYASGGDGTPMHLIMEAFKVQSELEITHIPYRGSAAEIAAALAGEVQMFFDNVPGVLPFVQRGELIALAVTGPDRLAELPDVPTLQELGIDAEQWVSWFGIMAPAGLPQDRAVKLNQAFVAAVSAPELKARLVQLGVLPWGSSVQDMSAFVERQSADWKTVVEKSGIRR